MFKLNEYLLLLIFIVLTGCTPLIGRISKNNQDSITSISIIPPSLKVNVESRSDNSNFYTTYSNNFYNVAISVTNMNNKPILINNIAINNDSLNHIFKIATDSNFYKITACTNNIKLEKNQICEIVISLNNSNAQAESNANLSINANGLTYKKSLFRNSSAYIAGDFSQVYAYESQTGIPPDSGSGFCGTNNNKPCRVIKYDFITKRIKPIITTNDAINAMDVDNSGNIYIAGNFDKAISSSESTIINHESGLSTIIVTVDSLTNSITDFIKNHFPNNSVYPDYAVYSMKYNHIANTLYIAGGFQSIGNIHATSGYPLVSYNLNENRGFVNSLGPDNNNPDNAITAISFDSESNLYLSGFYGYISNNYFNDGYSNRTINKCIQNGAIYSCLNGIYYSVSLKANDGQIEPAYSITTQQNGSTYFTGGFSSLFNDYTQLNLSSRNGSSIIAVNSNPVDNFANGSWSLIPTDNDNAIGVLTPYANNSFYVGGAFSRINNISSDENQGQCGTNRNSSCLLAQYNGNTWSKLFTTDGIINTLILVDEIGAE